jgi:hypothetical protein
VLPGARPHIPGTSDPSEDEDDKSTDDLDGFIEEDNNNLVELPAEFSMNTYQDLVHHFKIICQLFVHLALQEPGNRRAFMKKQSKGEFYTISGPGHS